MPLYEYECQSCGRRTELLQRFSDAPLSTCPHCGGAVRKLLSAPAVQFKGTGWYVTDYARAGKGNGSKESSEPKGGAGEAAAGKSAGDTQPTKSAKASTGD
ncbi:MAG: FmdB family zinc ribbon protein [Thermoanaerobaculia bacterium]